MVSSTLLDLPNHRKEVIDAVLRAGCFPLAMEHGSASSDSDAIQFSVAMVDQADIYVGIFAERYGFIPDNQKENPQGWSVSEHEYRRAVERGIPRLIYIASKQHLFTVAEIDFDQGKRAKLQALKEELGREICGLFESPERLQSLVCQSLFQVQDRQLVSTSAPQVPPTVPRPPELYAVPPYTLTTRFIGRLAELSELAAWVRSPDPVMVVEAIGGMGKSALTWEWTKQQAHGGLKLAGRVWWSFYEPGTSMETFLRQALAYVTQLDPGPLRDLDTYDSVQRLLTELKQRPYLLVLDGFERLLTAYRRKDKAQVPDDPVPIDNRECNIPRDGEILRELVHCGHSKVLVGSRLMPSVLQDGHTHQPIPGVRHLELAGLAPEDTLEMVQHIGVRGDPDAILRFAGQFGRHALVLRIVCGMITDYRPKPGDFDAWRSDLYAGGGLKLSELPLRQRYTHILDYAFRGLGEKTHQLLCRIAALSDANYLTIAALNPFLPSRLGPKEVPEAASSFWRSSRRPLDRASTPEEREAIEAEGLLHGVKHERKNFVDTRQALKTSQHQNALADLHSALSDLENRGLLQWDRKKNIYDLHPVVRASALEQLVQEDRARTYNKIGDHFASLLPERVGEATDLAQVTNSLEIVRALLGAGRFEEALGFWRGKLAQRLLFSIGAYNVVVEFLTPVVEAMLADRSVVADASNRGYALTALAIALSELGRPEEAIRLFCEEIQLELECERWSEVATALRNIANTTWNMNRLASSTRTLEMAHELAEAAGDDEGVTRSLVDQMATASTLGRFEEAESLFVSFRQRKPPPFAVYRSGYAEYWLAASRYFQGRLTAEDLDHVDHLTTLGHNLRERHQVLALRGKWELARGNFALALNATEQALSIAQKSGTPAAAYLAIRALGLARLGKSDEAREAVTRACGVWDGRTPQLPVLAAETWLALGDREQACAFLQRAYPLAWADGPPYIHWYYLNKCRELMAQAREPEPQLPQLDTAELAPVPFESEIRAAIKELKKVRP